MSDHMPSAQSIRASTRTIRHELHRLSTYAEHHPEMITRDFINDVIYRVRDLAYQIDQQARTDSSS